METVTITPETARLIVALTAERSIYGAFVEDRLYGPRKAADRATILSAIAGRKVPQSKAGINATMQAIYAALGMPCDRLCRRVANEQATVIIAELAVQS